MKTITGIVTLVGVVTAAVVAQTSAPTPVASIKQIQEAMISPSSDVIFNVGRAAPENDDEWLVVRNAAIVLAEAGNLFMMDGRARDSGRWMELSGELVEAGKEALAAVEARSAEGVLSAGDRIAAACEACHQPYRDGGRAMGPPPVPAPPQ